jgi:hypothetical protein
MHGVTWDRWRFWGFAALLLGVVAGHGFILHYVSSRVVLPVAVVSGALLVIVVRHLGVLGRLPGRFRRRQRP